MILRLTTFILSTIAIVNADPIRLSPSFFKTQEFKKSFVGSYGFLAPVEPKVSRAESELLVKVRELFDTSQFARAESELKRFITTNDGTQDAEGNKKSVSPAMVFVLGTLYNQSGRLDDALRAYKEAIRRYPNFRRAHTNLAFLYVKQEKLDKALPHLQKALELGDNSHRVYGLIGYAYLSDNNPVAAESAYRQAILLNGAEKEWQKGLAQTLILQEKFEESVAMLGSLIKEDPNNKNYYLQQTNALYEMDKKMEAAAVMEELRLRGMADANDLNQLGKIYINLDQPQLALFAYLAAIDAQKVFNPKTALESATILVEYGFPEKASTLVQKIRSTGVDQLTEAHEVQVYLVELKVAKASGKTETVGKILETLLSIDSANGEILLEKGDYHVLLAENADTDDERIKQQGLASSQYKLAARDPQHSYQANISLARQSIGNRDYITGLAFLEKAYELKSSENLKSYVKQIKRVATRQKQKEEKLKAERAAKEGRK